MSKNKALKIASILLVLVLATSCFVGNTFAKYITSAGVDDSARVAYWGFTRGAEEDFALFTTAYNESVLSSNQDNVVAPGTANSASFEFAYTDNADADNSLTETTITAPEVDYYFEIALTATGDYSDLDANTNFRWTLQMPGDDAAASYNTVAELKTAIEALNKTAATTTWYEAGTLPTGFDAGTNTITIGWAWDFVDDDVEGTTDKNEMAVQDAIDTAMGNEQNLDDVTFNISITATQRD